MTATQKHTPGPWKISKCDNGNFMDNKSIPEQFEELRTKRHTLGPLHFRMMAVSAGPGEHSPDIAMIFDNESQLVATCGERNNNGPANAARLVHCWNCHDELLEACKVALAVVKESVERLRADWPDSYSDGDEYATLQKLQSAIQLAEGKE